VKKESNKSINKIKFNIISIIFTFIFTPSGYAQLSDAYQPPPISTQTLATAAAETSSQSGDDLMKPENIAMAAAVTDVMTTGLAVAGGAVEMNPLVSTTPLGLLALAGTKIGFVKYVGTLPEPEKRVALKSSSSIWGGAAVNNIAVYLAAPPPFPVIAGLIMGFATWNGMSNNYETADKKVAASLAKKRDGNNDSQKLSLVNIK